MQSKCAQGWFRPCVGIFTDCRKAGAAGWILKTWLEVVHLIPFKCSVWRANFVFLDIMELETDTLESCGWSRHAKYVYKGLQADLHDVKLTREIIVHWSGHLNPAFHPECLCPCVTPNPLNPRPALSTAAPWPVRWFPKFDGDNNNLFHKLISPLKAVMHGVVIFMNEIPQLRFCLPVPPPTGTWTDTWLLSIFKIFQDPPTPFYEEYIYIMNILLPFSEKNGGWGL